jgi:hypothetical protein
MNWVDGHSSSASGFRETEAYTQALEKQSLVEGFSLVEKAVSASPRSNSLAADFR